MKEEEDIDLGINMSNEMQLYLGFISRNIHVSGFHHADNQEYTYITA
jgi:hypothetical protein